MEKEKSKVKKKNVRYETTEQAEIKNFIVVLIVVVLCVGGIYLATRLFVTKDLFKDEEEKVEEVAAGVVNYEVATMGMILNRPYDEYYVAIYDNTSTSTYFYDMLSLVYGYYENEKHLPVYTVDLANVMNESYYNPENVNVNAKTLAEIKVGDITLLKIKKGKIDKFIVDYAKMQKELGVEEK